MPDRGLFASRLLALALGVVVAACTAPAARDEAETKRDIGRRIEEICAMPKEQREAELERLKKESGLVINCGGEQ